MQTNRVDQSAAPSPSRPWGPVMAALVFLVALNLRPALTAVGPVLPRLGADLRIDEGAQGLIGSLPLLAFAAVSPVVHHVPARLGTDRTVLVAVVLLAGGILIRSTTGVPGLWVGTVVVGSAIAVGNVLVPVIVRRDYPGRVSVATGVYSACITLAAALASVAAVPLADASGWRVALGVWALPAGVVALVWAGRCLRPAVDAVRSPAASGPGSAGSLWRRRQTWAVTAFMGLQSTSFYTAITWLPTIEGALGQSAAAAGVHLFVFQFVGIASGLAIPRLMRSPTSQVGAALTAGLPLLIGLIGLLVAPRAAVVWVTVAGLGSGACLVVALSLIGMRGRSTAETAQLSGTAQSVGYLMAAAGPVLIGRLAGSSGGWQLPLAMMVAVAAALVVVAVPAGRP